MSKDSEIKLEMARLMGDLQVRKVVRYFELKNELAQRRLASSRATMSRSMDDVMGTNWGDSNS